MLAPDAATAARLSLSITRANVAKADLSAADLGSGGLLAPDQSARPNRRVRFRGIEVELDRPAGFVQTGTAKDGTEWSRTYKVDYGFIPGVESLGDAIGDGEDLDVYLDGRDGEYDESADDAYLLLQIDEGGKPDELKIVLGAKSQERAVEIFTDHAPARFLGGVSTMPVDMLKALLGLEEMPVDKAIRSIAKSLWSVAMNVMRAGFAAHEQAGALEKSARFVSVSKSLEAEERFVLAIVLEPDVVDAQGDIYSAEEIRKAQRTYMKRFQNIGLNHKRLINGLATMVDSYIARTDMEVEGSHIRKGTWLIGIEFESDELWDQVKSGDLTGVSIGGIATRDPIKH